jgi:hypothetical protein
MVLNAEDWLYIPVGKIEVFACNSRQACSLQPHRLPKTPEHDQFFSRTNFPMVKRDYRAKNNLGNIDLRRSRRLAVRSDSSTSHPITVDTDGSADPITAASRSSAGSDSALQYTGVGSRTTLPLSSSNAAPTASYLLVPEQGPATVILSFSSIPTYYELVEGIAGLPSSNNSIGEALWQPYQQELCSLYQQYLTAEEELQGRHLIIQVRNDMSYYRSVDRLTIELAKTAMSAYTKLVEQIQRSTRSVRQMIDETHERGEGTAQVEAALKQADMTWLAAGSMCRERLLHELWRVGLRRFSDQPGDPFGIVQKPAPSHPVLNAPTQS